MDEKKLINSKLGSEIFQEVMKEKEGIWVYAIARNIGKQQPKVLEKTRDMIDAKLLIRMEEEKVDNRTRIPMFANLRKLIELIENEIPNKLNDKEKEELYNILDSRLFRNIKFDYEDAGYFNSLIFLLYLSSNLQNRGENIYRNAKKYLKKQKEGKFKVFPQSPEPFDEDDIANIIFSKSLSKKLSKLSCPFPFVDKLINAIADTIDHLKEVLSPNNIRAFAKYQK